MKQTVYLSDFRRAFNESSYSDNFNHEGLYLLFEHCEGLEEAGGKELELDVVALCCEYEETAAEELISQYCDWLNKDVEDCDIIEFLEEKTAYVGKTSSGFVFVSF